MSLPERIAERVHPVRPAVALKTLAGVPFYLLGWIVGAVWFVLSWTWAAIGVGFIDGARRRPES